MTAVTTLERVLEIRHRLEHLLTLDSWLSPTALDSMITEVSLLPHSAERDELADDLLDLRIAASVAAQREQECPAK